MSNDKAQQEAREAWVSKATAWGFEGRATPTVLYLCGIEDFQSRLLEEIDKRIASYKNLVRFKATKGRAEIFLKQLKEIRRLITELKP